MKSDQKISMKYLSFNAFGEKKLRISLQIGIQNVFLVSCFDLTINFHYRPIKRKKIMDFNIIYYFIN